MKQLPSHLTKLIVTAILTSAQEAYADQFELLSTGLASVSVAGDSNSPDVTPDGRFVVFSSVAKLVNGDGNGVSDIFRLDRETGGMIRVSVSSLGAEANGASTHPSVSDDGRYVAFETSATNFSNADMNGVPDVYLRDLGTGNTVMVSRGTNGLAGAGKSFEADISGNGRYVAFTSAASNLVPGDTNGRNDVFAYEVLPGTLQRASESALGVGGNKDSGGASMSFSGSSVVFESASNNLVPGLGATQLIYSRSLIVPAIVVVSLTTGDSEPNGPCRNASVNAAGSIIAFESDGTNLIFGDNNGSTDVFLRFGAGGGVTRLASASPANVVGNADSYDPAISPEGNFLVFTSAATNLVSPDTNGQPEIFRRNLILNETALATLTFSGDQANGASSSPVVSENGRYVVYASAANNITSNDANGTDQDVFLAGVNPPPSTFCTGKTSSLGCTPSVSALGTASLSSASAYIVRGRDINFLKNGLFFYSPLGRADMPFFGGTLCVQPPLERTPIDFSGGGPMVGPCSGNFLFDLNDYLQSGNDPFTQAGDAIAGQFWFRDPDQADGTGVGLTNGIEIFVCH